MKATPKNTSTMETLNVLMVDDEPLIRKVVKFELNEQKATVDCLVNEDGTTVPKLVQMSETYSSGTALLSALNLKETAVPDYLLVDMELQGEPTGGLTIVRKMRENYPTVKLIVLSGRFDYPAEGSPNRDQKINEILRVVFEALNLGAAAFVSKNAIGGFSVENIVRAIACLERGEQCYFNYPLMLTLKEAAERYLQEAPPPHQAVTINEVEKNLLLLEAAGCTAQEIAFKLDGESDKTVQDKQKELSRKLDTVNKSGARIARALQLRLINANEIKYLKR